MDFVRNSYKSNFFGQGSCPPQAQCSGLEGPGPEHGVHHTLRPTQAGSSFTVSSQDNVEHFATFSEGMQLRTSGDSKWRRGLAPTSPRNIACGEGNDSLQLKLN